MIVFYANTWLASDATAKTFCIGDTCMSGVNDGRYGLPSNRYRKRHGRCYELCFKMLSDTSPEFAWVLVQGTCLAMFVGDDGVVRKRLGGHAWLELGDLVYDAVYDKFYETAAYLKRLNVESQTKFTREEMYKRMLSKWHLGPWDAPP